MDNYEQLKADNKRLKKQVKELSVFNSELQSELEFAPGDNSNVEGG
ncbi:hypothetical protein [Latilactobacillus sakei]|nr:hypothetical protein [Latilactobacillus sakei]